MTNQEALSRLIRETHTADQLQSYVDDVIEAVYRRGESTQISELIVKLKLVVEGHTGIQFDTPSWNFMLVAAISALHMSMVRVGNKLMNEANE